MTGIYIFSLFWMLLITVVFWNISGVEKTKKTIFTGVLLSTLFWGIFRFFVIFSEENGLLWVKASNFFGPLVPAFFMHFSCLIPEEITKLDTFVVRNRKILYSSALVVSLLVISNVGVKSVSTNGLSIDINEYGVGFVIYSIYFIALFTLSFLALIYKYKRLDNRYRRQILHIFVAVAIVFLINASFSLIPDIFSDNLGKYDVIADFPITIIAGSYLIYFLSLDTLKENRKLIELDKTKDDFVSMVSHQLRTPLTAINSYNQLLLSGHAGKISAQHRKLVKMSSENVRRTIRIINDLLDSARIESNNIVYEKQKTDISELANKIAESNRGFAKDKKITITKNITPSLYCVVDESKITEVISNFIDNAIAYSFAGSSITVSLDKTKNEATLTVSDAGIGVPPQDRKTIFDKFSRSQIAVKHRPDGSGLGLYVASEIIKAHRGKIIFKSRLNRGSTFGFSLPLAQST